MGQEIWGIFLKSQGWLQISTLPSELEQVGYMLFLFNICSSYLNFRVARSGQIFSFKSNPKHLHAFSFCDLYQLIRETHPPDILGTEEKCFWMDTWFLGKKSLHFLIFQVYIFWDISIKDSTYVLLEMESNYVLLMGSYNIFPNREKQRYLPNISI